MVEITYGMAELFGIGVRLSAIPCSGLLPVKWKFNHASFIYIIRNREVANLGFEVQIGVDYFFMD